MNIANLKIKNYRIFDDFEIKFKSTKDDGKNVVNIIAGVNGTGKTTILDAIAKGIQTQSDLLFLTFYEPDFNKNPTHQLVGQLTKNNKYVDGKHTSPRIIHMPACLNYNYQEAKKISTAYTFYNQINPNEMLGRAEYYSRNISYQKNDQAK